MYSEKVQLELLDRIAQTQGRDNFAELDLTGPCRQWNYDWLAKGHYVSAEGEMEGESVATLHYRTDSVVLTPQGEQRRFELREKLAQNRYLKGTFWVALVGAVAAVTALFQCNRSVEAPEPLCTTAENSAPLATESGQAELSVPGIPSPIAPCGDSPASHTVLP